MKKITTIITLLFGMFLWATPVSAGFGVSPSNIYHEYLKPGGHFEQKITLSRSDPDEDLEVIVEPALEEMRDWFKFDPGMKFTFPKGEKRMSLTAIVDVPSDAPYKTYQGIIRVKAMTKESVAGGVAVVKGARVDVELVTTKVNVTELEVRQMKMRDVVGGETLKLEIEATNKGNTEISPTARVKIMNLQMQTLEELEDSEVGVLKPNETKTLVAEFETKLGQGEYFAEAAVLGEGVVVRKERLVFRISEREKIEEMVISPKKWGEIGKLVGDRQYLTKLAIEILMATIIVLLVWYGKKWWLLAILALKAKHYLVLKIILAILTMLGLWVGAKQIMEMQQSKEVKQEESKGIETPTGKGSSGVDVTTGDGWVEGVSSEKSQVAVIGEADKAYPVYIEPNSKSRIVYYAKEGDNFAVLEEKSEWYRVVLPDTTSGWLAKTSVKSAESSQD